MLVHLNLNNCHSGNPSIFFIVLGRLANRSVLFILLGYVKFHISFFF